MFLSFLKVGILTTGFFVLSFSFTTKIFAQQQDMGMGSVLVCKILVDDGGNIIKSNQVSQSNFSIKIADNKSFTNPVDISFSTDSFSLNEHFLTNEYDSNCKTFDLPFGTYYYSKELISNNSSWNTPRYFDGLNFNSLSQTREYSDQLFNDIDSDDVLVNISSDGLISISEENPYRSIIIVNTYKNQSLDMDPGLANPPDTFKLIATSIVCDSESDLPNWGKNGSTDITATTSSDFLSSHPNCRPASGWNFEFILGYMDSIVPKGDFIGPATTTGFTVFGPTDINGLASTTVLMPTNPPVISVREHLKEGYIPFKFDINTNPSDENNYSAELYCYTDVIHYDNYDVVAGPIKDNTYHCVAFNVLNSSTTTPNTAPVITLIGSPVVNIKVGDLFTDPLATSTDREDGDITSRIVVTGSVNTTTVGTYTLTYTVTDSGGLSASTTRTVIVEPVSLPNDTARIIATSIVCDSESDLPNWGLGASDITASTTEQFLNTHPNCRVASDWKYQYGFKGSVLIPAHNFVGEVASTSGFTTFGPTNANGVAIVDIRMATSSPVVIRQVSKEDYIPFAGYENGNVSAEMYCGADVFNYDNIEELVGLNEGQTVYCVSFNTLKPISPINTPPVITLIGNNPFYVNYGASFVDPLATSTDREDGDITSRIVVTGTVGTIPGTYTLTYTVTDSGGLTASTTRTVIVREQDVSLKGSIKFCAVFVDKNNTIQLNKNNLPFGNFSIKLATSTDFDSTLYGQKFWTSNTFTPNQKVMSSVNDADCVTFNDLELKNYYYSQVSVNGSLWKVVKYNDQANMPVNNVFDMLPYSPELFNATSTDDASRNINSDGLLEVSSYKREHTVVLLFGYDEINQCLLPDVTSSLSVQATLNSSFSYQITASSSSAVTFDIGTSTLPAGLSFNSNTGLITGTPTEAGAFFVDLKATNSCGTTSSIRITIYVNTPSGGGGGGGTNPPPAVVTSGGGGGNGAPIVNNLVIFNEKVIEVTSGVALVTWDTNIPATRQVGFGTNSVLSASSTEPFGYASSTALISSPLSVTHSVTIPISADGKYYFRPVSKDSIRQVIGKELVLDRVSSSGSSCYYLFDYLKEGWNNNPVEVKKLQVFLRDLEGFDVNITGVYDAQTIKALNAFQNRYKDDVLTPWGHTAPTSFTYITTKKKVNEIYCKMAFPLTVQQQSEIDAFRNLLNSLKNENIVLPEDQSLDRNSLPTIINTNEVGVIELQNDDSLLSTTTNLSTLAGISTTTNDIASKVTATVVFSGKKIGELVSKIFGWPFGNNQCSVCKYCVVVKWILVLIIILLGYLLYREKRAYKKFVEINKELDLLNK